MYLKTVHGNYICADAGTIIGDRDSVGAWETFEVERFPGNKFAFKSWEEKYLSCSAEGVLEWNRDDAGPWEKFVIVLTKSGFAIKSFHGTYLCAEADGSITCNRNKAGPWECFEGVLPVTLRSDYGKYLSATPDGLEWNRDSAGPWEVFECSVDGGKVTFKSAHETYMCADGDDLVCDREEAGEWETFELVEGCDGCGFGLLTAHGKYICADADEEMAKADREEVGCWESFNQLHQLAEGHKNLIVELVKVWNLKNQGWDDEADPYVIFELGDYGTQQSSVKQDDRNPVYNETFVFESVESLEDLELKVKVMDEDADRHDKLGSCTVKLHKLNLEPVPMMIRKKVDDNVFGGDAYVLLNISWGEKAVDEDATGLSHVGQAAYECLRTIHSEHHVQLWNVTHGRVVGEIHQTPKEAFPGPSDAFEDGHDDWFPEIMGDILSRTEIWADVLSLGPPDGRFLTAFQGALAKVVENSVGRDKPIVIRMMFGNIPGMPVNCNKLRDTLTEGLPEDANIELWVGAWRRGTSWNHAKIIAVDGKYLHTGGHNMWDGHYLNYDPVHDLSLELEGQVTLCGHMFANKQWDFVETEQETFWGTMSSKLPDGMPQIAMDRVIVSEWPVGKATEYPPQFTVQKVFLVEFKDQTKRPRNAIPIITMGRYGCLLEKDRPSDDAFIAMMDSAQTIIHLALQDLGPVCLPGTKIALPGTSWPDAYLCTLAKAIWERGVDVEIVVSNPGSIPGGLSPLEACYGNGWSCVDVAAEIIKRIKKQYPDADDGDLRQKVQDNLRVAFIREERGNTWEDGMNMGMHAKHFIVDDVATYIGSQNLYVCDLAEWGVVIDDKEQTKKFMEEYWNPLWEHSHTGEDVDVDAVMDGLDIDRDGGDPSEIDEETQELMKEAEKANAGASGSEMYAEEEEA